MIVFIVTILFLFGLQSVGSTASNSLSDCNVVAAKFSNTCNGAAVSNIVATTGTNVSCSSGFTSTTCPGQMYGSTCVFQHKLCVTCSGSSTIRIRVQSNGLPRFCPNVPVTMSELNVDFAVNFNPNVDVNSPVYNPTTVSQLSSIVCNINSQTTVPSASNYVPSSTSGSFNTLAGISVDGVTLLNVNSANNVDPFYPAGSFVPESVDSCLGHPNPSNNGYHYHIASGCALNPPTGKIASCKSTPACNASIAAYTISTFSSYRTLTVIGIAKDGHVIYGPYNSQGVEVTSGFDICNGMFYDSIGNYAYFATRTYPYITGCFGPGNYPSVFPNCTTNKATAYTKSIYALNQTRTTKIAISTDTIQSNSQRMPLDNIMIALLIIVGMFCRN
ncbi:unnamed protein product [Rotaria sp. Silwood2]|nr:unnamed protein product [Rotaria sp. Silwood2]CAF3096748.1 unnamed protein product [Rotaria sp. Silwood2]CAF4095483.1 unnamed protein product [Rotaria sp. Silwood2]CAF4138381.1 unnamed protein product [Rotaria sp. Silwood2]CAF4466302.1 unnamed protein product [Rotaria sp. Silwood2]